MAILLEAVLFVDLLAFEKSETLLMIVRNSGASQSSLEKAYARDIALWFEISAAADHGRTFVGMCAVVRTTSLPESQSLNLNCGTIRKGAV